MLSLSFSRSSWPCLHGKMHWVAAQFGWLDIRFQEQEVKQGYLIKWPLSVWSILDMTSDDPLVLQVSTAPLKDPLFLHARSRMKEKRAALRCLTGFNRPHTIFVRKYKGTFVCNRNGIDVWLVHYRVYGWVSVGEVSKGTEPEHESQQVQK